MSLSAVEPGACPVCLRPECGAGFGPKYWNGHPPVLTCEEDLPLARQVHQMKSSGLLHRIEAESLRAAGAVAGNWLLAHGETDMAKLTPPAWETFLGIFRSALAEQMRLRLSPAKG